MQSTDRPSLAAGLAPRYVDVLLLELLGWGDAEIADCLDVDRAALPNLRRLAHRKLEQLLGPSPAPRAAGPFQEIGPGVVGRRPGPDGGDAGR